MKQLFYAVLIFACVFGGRNSFAQVRENYRVNSSTDGGSLSSTIRSPEPVNSMIWRSGRPTSADYRLFSQQGIKIIINLEDNQAAVQQDAAMAQQAGMQFHSFPMNGFAAPNDQTVNQVLALLKNPQAKTLVHCHLGEDRTGVIIGLERVFNEGWHPQQAYQEMLQKGFHQGLFNLDKYFRAKTGL